MIRRLGLGLILTGIIGAGIWLAPQFVLAQEFEEPEVVISDLTNPQGVLVAPDGSVWAIDSGFGGEDTIEFVDPVTGDVTDVAFGESARVVRVGADGEQEDVATLPSLIFGEEFVGGARLALLDDVLYATSGMWTGFEDNLPASTTGMSAIMRIEEGSATEVLNLARFERRMNPDGTVYESHPYGLATGPDGKLWVADAGANSLLRVDPETLSVELISTFPALPGVFPSPTRGGEMLTDPVPTGITFDDEGTAYVSYLSGAPFVPGSAKVVSIGANGRPVDYATGLTMLTDLRTAPNGDMFAVQFAVFTEQGPQFDSGAIVRVRPGEDSEVVFAGLPFPTSIDFNEDGDAFIAIGGVGPPGSGAVIRVADLMNAEALPPMAATADDEEMAEPEVMEATPTPVAEEEAEEEMMEPTATPVAEEEAEAAMADDEDVMSEPGTIVDIAQDNEDFSTLVAALAAAGLVEPLEGEGPFTVFAPTNEAFAALPEGIVETLLADPQGDLTQILLYHVIDGVALSTDLSDGLEVQTLQGDAVTFTIADDGSAMVNEANIIATDIVADNGVIHVIDAVLLPPATADESSEMMDEEMAEEDEAMADEAMAEEEMAEEDEMAAPSPAATPAAEEEAMMEEAAPEAEPTAMAAEEMTEEEMAEDEMADDEMAEEDETIFAPAATVGEEAEEAPDALPATGGSGTSLPLAVGVVLLVVGVLALNVWREKRLAA